MYLLLEIVGFFLANSFYDCREAHGVQHIRTLLTLPDSLASTNYTMRGFCDENYLLKLFSDLA